MAWRLYHLQPVSVIACYDREKLVKIRFQLIHSSATPMRTLCFSFVITQQRVDIKICFKVWEDVYKTQQMLGTLRVSGN
jgi:hypothetical protein